MCKDLLNDRAMHAFLFIDLVPKSGVYKFCNHEVSRESTIGNNTTEQLLV